MDTQYDKAYLANTLSHDTTMTSIKLYHSLEKVCARVCLYTVAAGTPLPLVMLHPRDFTSTKSQQHPASLQTEDANSLNITQKHMQTERGRERGSVLVDNTVCLKVAQTTQKESGPDRQAEEGKEVGRHR